jgi:hypothetical protein
MMLFNVRGDTRAGEGPAHRGWLLGIDQAGAMRCVHQCNHERETSAPLIPLVYATRSAHRLRIDC